MQAVREDMDLRVLPRDELPVVPDPAVALIEGRLRTFVGLLALQALPPHLDP